MIIRKPYAFLIKHFRKIHIALLILSVFIFYINITLRDFVRQFMEFQTYDQISDPISKYINIWLVLDLFLLFFLFGVLLFLLRYKKKPWKLYILPIGTYLLFGLTCIFTYNFFTGYTGNMSDTTNIRALRDLLFITYFLNYPVFVFLLVRIIGLDLSKFSFQNDKEYLDLSSEDREEIEINFEFDKHSIKRSIKRLFRNLTYVYKEHKFKISFSLFIGLLFISFLIYRNIFIINKVYKQGQDFQSNNFLINISNAYITDKDYTGNVIDHNNKFLILEVNIKNLINDDREVDFNKFHIKNGVDSYTYTSDNYATDFEDFDNIVDNFTLRSGQTSKFTLIYKVSKDLENDKFVLYYQEINGFNMTQLRKIKIKVKDVSKIIKQKEKKMNENISFGLLDDDYDFTLRDYVFGDNASYYKNVCTFDECKVSELNVNSIPGKKIMKISFSSDYSDGKELIDILSKYGKIVYKDSKGSNRKIAVENPIETNYYGKYLYTYVPDELVSSESIKINITIRNKKYVYVLK